MLLLLLKKLIDNNVRLSKSFFLIPVNVLSKSLNDTQCMRHARAASRVCSTLAKHTLSSRVAMTGDMISMRVEC